MQDKSKKFGRAVFNFSHFLVILLYLFVCLVPFLPADKFWFIAILGLIFPLLFIIVVLFLFISILLQSRWLLLSIVAILLSWKQLTVMFTFRMEKHFAIEKPDSTVRILSWNVSRWHQSSRKNKAADSLRSLMLNLIQAQNADILCLQEFFEPHHPKFEMNIPPLEQMGFKYHYFLPAVNLYNGTFYIGLIILSRFPFIDSTHIKYQQKTAEEDLIYVDLSLYGQTLRIFTTHLQSVRLNSLDYESLPELENRNKGVIAGSKSLIGKLKRAYQFRANQAEELKKVASESPYPAIICGDFNDIPNSYTYFKIKGKLQDAFLEKGSGLGRTFRFISPTLRIDYILAEKNLQVMQYKRLKVPYSDHYPIVADLKLTK